MKSDKAYYNALARSPVLLKKLFQDVVEAEFLDRGVATATHRLAEALGQTMALADVLGRNRVLDRAHAERQKTKHFYLAESPIHPGYDSIVVARFSGYKDLHDPSDDAFNEAFDSLLAREPRVAKDRDEIQKAYGLGKWFSLAALPGKLALKAAQQLTVRLWEKVTELGIQGRTPVEAKRVLSEMGDFSESYAETVYRTNLAGAYTAGRFKQMADPDVQAVTPAFEYTAVGDHSTRPNHKAADGLIAAIHDPVWDKVSPPMGYNCRCDLRVVDRFELQDRGLFKGGKVRTYTPSTFREAHPDKGFTITRPDRRVY